MTTEQWIDFREWAQVNKPPGLPFGWWWWLCRRLERLVFE